ncbi:MAG: hypothetical protein H0U57_03225 [Tatlockia sp.]|nr:hypothetical protein [Tatlockia sp.]
MAKSKLKTPWHLWLVGIAGLFWNAIGAFDFVMTQTKNQSYMKAFASDQLAFFYGLPLWVKIAWGIAVWGGVIGSILLLLRKRDAIWVFLFSFVAALLTTFNNYVLSNGMQVMGDTFSLVMTAIILLVALGLYLYASVMQRRGLLV